jgi:hypothetical protein
MLIFDLETDGLYNDVTTIHCLVIFDTESEETLVFNDNGTKQPVVRGVEFLEDADCIVGHNIINYDLCVLRKLYPWFRPSGTIVDTLLLSRLYHSDILKLDQTRKWPQMPLKLYGRHSLESYGYRLKCYKGDFGKTSDWSEWSQEMEDYCVTDVKLTTKLCNHFQNYLNGSR